MKPSRLSQVVRLIVLTQSLQLFLPETSSAQNRPTDAICRGDQQSYSAKVVSVADGDTARVLVQGVGAIPIRFDGIDTPETFYRGKNQGDSAKLATDFTKSQLPVGSEVIIHLSAQRCDSYGRVIAVIEKNGVDINRKILSEGYAVPYCLNQSTLHCRDYARVARQAARKNHGLWPDLKAGTLQTPYEWRRLVDGRSMNLWVADVFNSTLVTPGEDIHLIEIASRAFFTQKPSATRDPWRGILGKIFKRNGYAPK